MRDAAHVIERAGGCEAEATVERFGVRLRGEHDLLRVRTDAEKYLMMAALNLVECVAFVGAANSP